jgi:hypothetical protein
MKSMQRNLARAITSWPFGLSLLTLLINDAWLKAARPGALSGKLSDVAGVAVVTLMLLAAFPRRAVAIYGAMLAAFAWWKGPFSQPFIDAVNVFLPFHIGRTVDYTDLFALLVMPLCHRVVVDLDSYAIPWPQARRLSFAPLVAATLFGLMATSRMPPMRQEYVVRRIDTTAELSQESVAEVISAVAEEHGLSCTDCAELPATATYRDGKQIEMRFEFISPNAVSFGILVWLDDPWFGPSSLERADRLRSDLKRALASQFKGLEYVEALDTE